METKIAFGGGFTAVFGYSSYLLKIDLTQIAVDTAIKIAVTLIVGIVGGIAGLLGKEIYNQYLKKYFNGNDKSQEQ